MADGGPVRRSLDPGLARRLHTGRIRRGIPVWVLGRLSGISHSVAAYVCAGARILDLADETAEDLWEAAVIRAWPGGQWRSGW